MGYQIRSASTGSEAPDFYGLSTLVELPSKMSLVRGRGTQGAGTGENVIG